MASKSPITEAQIGEIRALVRKANRRLRMADEGQRSALEYWVKKYTGDTKFSSAGVKNLTYGEGNIYLKNLYNFLNARGSTRSGWKAMKKESIQHAVETINKDYEVQLTDEEFAEIVKLTKGKGPKEFYEVLRKVIAAKGDAGDDWKGVDDIAEAVAETLSAQEALERALEYRRTRRSRRDHKARRR